MIRNTFDEEDDDDSDDWQYDADDEGEFIPEDDGDEPTIECPYCGNDVHEDSPRCPVCENYLTREETSTSHKPLWFLVGAGL